VGDAGWCLDIRILKWLRRGLCVSYIAWVLASGTTSLFACQLQAMRVDRRVAYHARFDFCKGSGTGKCNLNVRKAPAIRRGLVAIPFQFRPEVPRQDINGRTGI
jgi:hypothetical protein